MSDAATAEPERLRRLRDRHFGCYLDLAAAAEETGIDRPAWLEVLESELANIRSALEWGLSTARAETAAFAASLGWYWQETRRFAEGRKVLDRVLHLSHLPVAARVDALYVAGNLAGDQRDLAAARQRYEASRDLAASAAERYRQARAAVGLGWASYFSSLAQPAVDAFTEALEHSDELSVSERASALRGLSGATRLTGDTDAALQLLREARQILEEASDADLPTHYAVETNVLVQLGHPAEAMVLADKSIALAQAGAGNLTLALIAKDKAAEALGDMEVLRRTADEGIAVTKAAGDAKWEARFQRRLADHAFTLGDVETGRIAVERGLRLLDGLHDLNLGDVQVRAALLDLAARLAEDEGHLDAAEELQRQVVAGYGEASPDSRALALASLARLLGTHGDTDAARLALVEAAAELDRVQHDAAIEAKVQLAILDQDLEAALRLDGDALESPSTQGAKGLTWRNCRRAMLLADLGRPEDAASLLDEPPKPTGARPDTAARARAYVDRARIRIALGDAPGARADLLRSASCARISWATDQLNFATTFAGLALVEGRHGRAAEIWGAVVNYRDANRRVASPLARRFEEPLEDLVVNSEAGTASSREALDALRRLVAEEFEALTAQGGVSRP